MLLYLKLNNYTIYNQEVEFSMMANMHYSRFPSNVASVDGVHVLKTAVLLGPNNTGKTNFVRAIAMMKAIMLNQSPSIVPNIFSGSAIVEASISFLESGKEYTRDELRKLLSGHLCRCTGYENILNAVEKTMKRRLGKA